MKQEKDILNRALPKEEKKGGDIIEEYEKEYGCRVEADNFLNNAFTALVGMVAREMGRSSFDARDDLAVGTLILSEAYKRRQDDMELFASLIRSGVSPDTIINLFGKKR